MFWKKLLLCTLLIISFPHLFTKSHFKIIWLFSFRELCSCSRFGPSLILHNWTCMKKKYNIERSKLWIFNECRKRKPHQTIFRATSKYKMRVLQSLLGTFIRSTPTAPLKGKYYNMQILPLYVGLHASSSIKRNLPE